MGRRRTARERALQVLFELEFSETPAEDVLRRSWRERPLEDEVRDYAGWLVRGVLAQREEIDRRIQAAARNWRLARMPVIDRNILRLAVLELLDGRFLAPPIVINEAIEIAKRYSGDESAVFVNGVLDAVRKSLSPPAAPPPPAGSKAEPHERTPKARPTRRSAAARSGSAGRKRRGPAKV